MRAWIRTLIVAAVALPAAIAWSAAGADEPKAAPKRYDANNQTAMSESMANIVEGARKFVEKDVEGAMVSFRKAVALQPRNPVAQYVLGEALLSQGKAAEAEAALLIADDTAPQTSPYKARILFLLASSLERQRKWDDAKEAWQRYLRLGQSRPDAGVYAQSANERLRLIDELVKLDAAYVGVRARIAAGSGTPDADPKASPDGGK